MSAILFLNGKFVLSEEAKISALDAGFLYGFGVFETMRAYKKRIVYFSQHIKRIQESAKLIGIRSPYASDKLKGIIKETVRRNCFRDAYVRLTLWRAKRGTGIFVLAREYKPHSEKKYKNGFKICVSRFRQNEFSLLAKIKTTSRILYQLSFEEAKNKGFDEAIILNNRGVITEGTRSNIFFAKNNEIFTPALECGCLDGITRKVVFDLAKRHKIKICEGKFSLQDLLGADEAFLTNSLMGVMPLAAVEGRGIGKGKCARLTKFFIERYSCLLK